jgi:hypothetical protein
MMITAVVAVAPAAAFATQTMQTDLDLCRSPPDRLALFAAVRVG